MRRNIQFPNYANYTQAQTIRKLTDARIGDYVIRPSSKRDDCLTLSWKFYDNHYVHNTILEENKTGGASLGAVLRIGSEEYSSLQEINDRYMKEVTKRVNDVVHHAKFIKMSCFADMEEFLKGEQKKNPKNIPYRFTILTEYPQHVVLSYISPSKRVIKEFIKVRPRGFWFHNMNHISFDHMIAWFKSNYRDMSYRKFVKKQKSPRAVTQQVYEEMKQSSTWE